MQFIRFLISFSIVAKYVIKFGYGVPCKGLFCHTNLKSDSNKSLYIQHSLNTTSRTTGKPVDSIPFYGITDSQKTKKHCCYNGGMCFLGAFCICPYEYTGRLCEFEKWPKHCAGGILNGEWVLQSCSLCRCLSGKLNCLQPLPDCEPPPEPNSSRPVGFTDDQAWILLLILITVTVSTTVLNLH
ncbi:cryptic family protein 1B-like [Hyperolius riggenbachi]|uniref:cryptic family protein 1B-like n=1 Tax=Hyperolius riggenbachi TaxID=752182 RepID=UPI0035A30996